MPTFRASPGGVVSGTESPVLSSFSHSRSRKMGPASAGTEGPCCVLTISWKVVRTTLRPLKACSGGGGEWERGQRKTESTHHIYFIPNKINSGGASYMLKMKSWGWLALLLGALLGTVWARRSQDLHCGGKGIKRREEAKVWEKDEWKSLL